MYMYVSLNIVRKQNGKQGGFWFGNILFTETNYPVSRWTVFVIRCDQYPAEGGGGERE